MSPAELLLVSWSNIHRSQRPGIILAERYFSLVDAVAPLNETSPRSASQEHSELCSDFQLCDYPDICLSV